MDVWLSLNITEASLRPTITGSPAAFLRHWASPPGDRWGLLHTANPTRVGMVLFPAGSEVTARLWTDSPSCFYLGFSFFHFFFILLSLVQTNRLLWKVRSRFWPLCLPAKQLKSLLALCMSASPHLRLRKRLKLIISGNIASTFWVNHVAPTSSIFKLIIVLFFLLHRGKNIFSTASSAPKCIQSQCFMGNTHTWINLQLLLGSAANRRFQRSNLIAFAPQVRTSLLQEVDLICMWRSPLAPNLTFIFPPGSTRHFKHNRWPFLHLSVSYLTCRI